MEEKDKYPFEMRPLKKEEGGGWLISFPDLPGCISDGETPEDAVECWIHACKEAGRHIPAPGDFLTGKVITRIPKSMHIRLASRAKQK